MSRDNTTEFIESSSNILNVDTVQITETEYVLEKEYVAEVGLDKTRRIVLASSYRKNAGDGGRYRVSISMKNENYILFQQKSLILWRNVERLAFLKKEIKNSWMSFVPFWGLCVCIPSFNAGMCFCFPTDNEAKFAPELLITQCPRSIEQNDKIVYEIE